MRESSFHDRQEPLSPPPANQAGTLTVLQHLVRAYQSWQDVLKDFPKTTRYTLGTKIDGLFVETIELIFSASILPKERKLAAIERAVAKFDLLKFFLRVSWEIKAIDSKKYTMLSTALDPIGKMLGGTVAKHSLTAKTTIMCTKITR